MINIFLTCKISSWWSREWGGGCSLNCLDEKCWTGTSQPTYTDRYRRYHGYHTQQEIKEKNIINFNSMASHLGCWCKGKVVVLEEQRSWIWISMNQAFLKLYLHCFNWQVTENIYIISDFLLLVQNEVQTCPNLVFHSTPVESSSHSTFAIPLFSRSFA